MGRKALQTTGTVCQQKMVLLDTEIAMIFAGTALTAKGTVLPMAGTVLLYLWQEQLCQ
jgi:hypothetical protein